MIIRLLDNHGLYKSGSRLDVIAELGEQLIKDGKATRIVTAKSSEHHTVGEKPMIVKRSNKKKLK